MTTDLRRLICCVGLLWLCGAGAQADAPECFVLCAQGQDKACLVNDGSRLKDQPLPERQTRRIGNCPSATLVQGKLLQGLVMTPRGLQRFEINEPSKPFKDKHAGLFQRPGCLGLNPACTESRDLARVAAVAGKGIDAVTSRRAGAPCALGLPCGAILSTATARDFELLNWPHDGVLRLRALRGQAAETTIAVKRGRGRLPPGVLAPGAPYAYVLADGAGTEVAVGEFSVLSARMQADVDAELRALQPGAAGEVSAFDRIEVLLQNELEWDAMLLSR